MVKGREGTCQFLMYTANVNRFLPSVVPQRKQPSDHETYPFFRSQKERKTYNTQRYRTCVTDRHTTCDTEHYRRRLAIQKGFAPNIKCVACIKTTWKQIWDVSFTSSSPTKYRVSLSPFLNLSLYANASISLHLWHAYVWYIFGAIFRVYLDRIQPV